MKHDVPTRIAGAAPSLFSRAGLLGLSLVMVMGLAACETSLNQMRMASLGGDAIPSPVVEPRAVALALRVTEDQRGLTEPSLREANRMLFSQGRLQSQTLSITPFNDRGDALAKRLAQALVRSGARPPLVKPRLTDAARLKEAQDNAWDLELQSEALVVSLPDCRVARPDALMLHPYEGMGRLGCATRANLAAMVSDPRDLVRPRTLDGGNGAAAVSAVTRYQEGDIRALVDIDFKD